MRKEEVVLLCGSVAVFDFRRVIFNSRFRTVYVRTVLVFILLEFDRSLINYQTMEVPVIIVGAGPSGLAVSACLSNVGIRSMILEKSNCVASLWRYKTYDRLKLHLPKQFCELPLMKFPPEFPKYPSKDQFISYLDAYAARFQIKPRFGCTVTTAEYDVDNYCWKIRTSEENVFLSRWLVVATGENAEPVLPEMTGMTAFGGRIIHSCCYKSGKDFEGEKVLIVGCGNSGMEIGFDLCSYNARPFIVARNSVRSSVHGSTNLLLFLLLPQLKLIYIVIIWMQVHVLPREILGISTFSIAISFLKLFPLKFVDNFLLVCAHLLLGNTDKIGLCRPKIGPLELKNTDGKTPILDVGAISQIKSGKIKVTKGVKEITKTGARFDDGKEEDFDAIILATGYKSNISSWLKEDYFDKLFSDQGMPRKLFPDGWKGKKALYSVGFTFRGLLGTCSDSMNIARDIASQLKNKPV